MSFRAEDGSVFEGCQCVESCPGNLFQVMQGPLVVLGCPVVFTVSVFIVPYQRVGFQRPGAEDMVKLQAGICGIPPA